MKQIAVLVGAGSIGQAKEIGIFYSAFNKMQNGKRLKVSMIGEM